jgi:hypothetical protein
MPFAAGASVFQPDMVDDLDARRNGIELLGSLLADARQDRTIMRTDLVGLASDRSVGLGRLTPSARWTVIFDAAPANSG